MFSIHSEYSFRPCRSTLFLAALATLGLSTASAQFSVFDHLVVTEGTSRTLHDDYVYNSELPAGASQFSSGSKHLTPDVTYTYRVETDVTNSHAQFTADYTVNNPNYGFSGDSTLKLSSDTDVSTYYWDNVSSYTDREVITFANTGGSPFSATFTISPTVFDFDPVYTDGGVFEVYAGATYTLTRFNSMGVQQGFETNLQYARRANQANDFFYLDDGSIEAVMAMNDGDYLEIATTYDFTTSLTVNGSANTASTGSMSVDVIFDLSITDITDGVTFSGSEGSTFTMSAVPEPSTYAAILGAVVLGGVAWRRRTAAKQMD